MRPSVVLLVFLALAAACHQSEPVVGKAYLIEATGTRPAPPADTAPTIELGVTPIPDKLSGPVRVAIDRDVPYRTAIADMQKVRAAGGIPAPLVAVRERTEELLPPDDKTGEAINLWADPDGKACVAPPGSETATCINGQATQHIDRAFVRDVMLKAVKEYDMKRVHVIVDPTVTWGDAVRAIDGARTCCGDAKIEVSVTPSW
jgi:hypothetical protein